MNIFNTWAFLAREKCSEENTEMLCQETPIKFALSQVKREFLYRESISA